MNLQTFADYSTLSRATADLIANYIATKKNALVCLASGHSPKGVFEYLISDVKSGKLDLDDCTFISLDEWIGIAPDQKGSCREMMDTDFFGPLHIPESRILFFDGMTTNPAREVTRINQRIEENGGLDIMLVGVGTNGHIAMNEPGTSFETVAHVSMLAEETKTVGQKYFPEATVLNQGITLGLKQFREARLPILMANGEKKAAIIQKILSSPAVESIPASIVHIIPHAYVMLDKLVHP